MAHPILVAVTQKGSLKEISITSDKFSIGRGLQNGFVVEDVNVSRTHCVFELHNNVWTISDKSSNGTWLNGELLDKSVNHPLTTGDIIGLSDLLKFVFKIPSSTTSSRAVGKGEKKIYSEEDILNIADSVIADVEAFQAEYGSDKFNETVFNNVSDFNQPGASSSTSTVNTVTLCSNTNTEANSVGPHKLNELRITKLVQQPIISFVIPKQEGQSNTQQLSGPSEVPLLTKNVDSSGKSDVPPCDTTKPKDGSQNNSAAPPQPTSSLDYVEDELQCSICTEMFVQAVTLSCSHTFCKHCINQWQKNQTFCPICRQKITVQFPTRVIDNFIEKIVENASDDVKQHRRELLEQRQSEATPAPAPAAAVATTSTSSSSGRSRPVPDPVVEISSGEENDDTTEDYDDYMSDYSGSDSDDGWFEYNGLPGQYYGGYGHCFSCGQRGHWANGCPNKRR